MVQKLKTKLLFYIPIIFIAFVTGCTGGDPFSGENGSEMLGMMCVLLFGGAILGGFIALISKDDDRRGVAVGIALVGLAASLIIMA